MYAKRVTTIGLLLVLILLVSACAGGEPIQVNPEPSVEPIADMANPAAVYCDGLGYTLENVTRNGGEDADCIFPDGSRCGQWDFLSGRCGQKFSFCGLQGHIPGEGTNIGTCQFPDGSICDEFLFFTGDCSPGDNPAAEAEEVPVQIVEFSEARDFIAAYLANQYGVEVLDPWLEQNITPEDAVGSSTIRFVSGPISIVISALASAPGPSEFTIKEASNISNGFYWEGSLTSTGDVFETLVIPPGTILNVENARDGVIAHLITNYGLPPFGDWTDQGYSQTESDSSKKTFTSESWVVTVIFEPAAPLVSNYLVTVDNLSARIHWEGEISIQGEILEINFID